jgi:hypothetical protein
MTEEMKWFFILGEVYVIPQRNMEALPHLYEVAYPFACAGHSRPALQAFCRVNDDWNVAMMRD